MMSRPSKQVDLAAARTGPMPRTDCQSLRINFHREPLHRTTHSISQRGGQSNVAKLAFSRREKA